MRFRGWPHVVFECPCFHDGVPDLWPDACAEHAVLSHAADVCA